MALVKRIVVITLTLWGQIIICGAVHSPNSVQLCDESPQHIAVSSVGSESSLIVDLAGHTSSSQGGVKMCQKTFLAEPRHAFFIRILRYSRPQYAIVNEMQKIEWSKKHLPNLRKTKEYSCPLEINIINDTMVPAWKIDPCKLEYENLMEAPRFQPGQLKISWKSNGYSPAVKLLITVVGNGEVCHDSNRFVCLGIGDVPLLCIAHELTCDNIEHCPSGSDMRNDEDAAMCFERNGHPMSGNMNIWQQLSFNWLKDILRGNSDGQEMHENVVMPLYTTTERTGAPNPRQKSTLTRGLAKYGPWGYLMLGMLVCGAALLICGLWECCCRRFKPELDDSISSIDNPSILAVGDASVVSPSAPPNYEELDSPPAYAILFPAQKSPDSPIDTISQPEQRSDNINQSRGNSSNSQHL